MLPWVFFYTYRNQLLCVFIFLYMWNKTKCSIVNIRHICICWRCVLVCFQPQHNTFFLAVSAESQTSQRLQRSAASPHKVLNILLLFKPVLSNLTGSFHLCSLNSLNVGFEKHAWKKKEWNTKLISQESEEGGITYVTLCWPQKSPFLVSSWWQCA